MSGPARWWRRRRPAPAVHESKVQSGTPRPTVRDTHLAWVASINPADLWGNALVGPTAYREWLDKRIAEDRNIWQSVHGHGGMVPADWVEGT